VESYLRARGIPWCSDTTNTDERFLRNRVRLRLLPLLNGYFPGWKRGLEALGRTQRLAADFIDAQARRRIAWEWAYGSRGRELRSGADRFFKEPELIREEALFRGLNLFRAAQGGAPEPVKRRSLRRFALGELRDLDLGFCRVALTGDQVSIFRRPGQGEAGFSLLIKEPGLYKLESVLNHKADSGGGAVVRVWERKESPSARRSPAGEGFFAALPLVLRPFLQDPHSGEGKRLTLKQLIPRETQAPPFPALCFQDTVMVQDAAGTAALIGVSPRSVVILWQRELQGGGALFFCGIGGIDVQ
jgi:tRNA(Ile)-lysidine synthase